MGPGEMGIREALRKGEPSAREARAEVAEPSPEIRPEGRPPTEVRVRGLEKERVEAPKEAEAPSPERIVPPPEQAEAIREGLDEIIAEEPLRVTDEAVREALEPEAPKSISAKIPDLPEEIPSKIVEKSGKVVSLVKRQQEKLLDEILDPQSWALQLARWENPAEMLKDLERAIADSEKWLAKPPGWATEERIAGVGEDIVELERAADRTRKEMGLHLRPVKPTEIQLFKDLEGRPVEVRKDLAQRAALELADELEYTAMSLAGRKAGLTNNMARLLRRYSETGKTYGPRGGGERVFEQLAPELKARADYLEMLDELGEEALKAEAEGRLESLGFQNVYEKVANMVRRSEKPVELTPKQANKLKRDAHVTARKIWGDNFGEQYEAFKDTLFGEKISAADMSPNQLQALNRGLRELQNRTKAPTGGSKTKIVKHRTVTEGKWKGKAPAINEYEGNLVRNLPEVRHRPSAWSKENAIRPFEELGKEFKEIVYDEMINKEVRSRREYLEVIAELKERKQQLPRRSEERIGIHAAAKQRNGLGILKAMGKRAVKLSPKELKMYNWMRDKLKEFHTRINAARKASGKPPIGEVDNYFTFWRVMSDLMKDGHEPAWMEAELFNTKYKEAAHIHRRTTPFRFAKRRKKHVRAAIRLDAFNVFDIYTEKALQHIHKSPLIARGREYLTEFPDGFQLKQARPRTHKFLTQWLDAAAGQKLVVDLPPMVEKGLAALNRNMTFAVLSANVRSALIQPSALVNTVAEIGPYYTEVGIQGIFQPKVRSQIMGKSRLILRQYDVAVREAMEGVTGKLAGAKKVVGGAALKPLQLLDMETAMATWWGSYQRGLRNLKMTEREAITYANDTVTKTQASALEIDLAPIQRHTLGRTLSLFQTFVINNWNFLRSDVLGIGNKNITRTAAMKKAATWVAGATLLNIFYEDVLDINSPLPTPIRAFMEAQERGESDAKTALRVAKEGVELVPLIGGGLRYGSHPLGPIASWFEEAGEKISDKPGVKKPWFDIIGRPAGIPGTAQIGKYTKRRKRGESVPSAVLGRKYKGGKRTARKAR
jgi:hypothetical protein